MAPDKQASDTERHAEHGSATVKRLDAVIRSFANAMKRWDADALQTGALIVENRMASRFTPLVRAFCRDTHPRASSTLAMTYGP